MSDSTSDPSCTETNQSPVWWCMPFCLCSIRKGWWVAQCKLVLDRQAMVEIIITAVIGK